MIKEGVVQDIETSETVNKEAYTRYRIGDEWFTAFKECKGKACKGDVVKVRVKKRGEYQNIQEFLTETDIKEEDSYYRLVAFMTLKELIKRNIFTTDERWEKDFYLAFEKINTILKAIRGN